MHHVQSFSRLASCTGLALAMLMPAAIADAQPAGWSPPRTADGRIDLNGVWANNAATPLERPDSLAGKAAFSEEEVAQLRASAERLFGGADDAAFADGVFNAVLADVEKKRKFTLKQIFALMVSNEIRRLYSVPVERLRFVRKFMMQDAPCNHLAAAIDLMANGLHVFLLTDVSGDGGTGYYSSVWMVDREFENRTSLITDPPDGKVPALTPQAEARIEAARVYREAHPADGPEDRTRQVRCVTYGIPRVGGLGAGYNSYYQIFQTPDHLVMLGEMIHDARVIPIRDMPHADDDIRLWHGDSRGHWDGDALVVETTNYSPKSGYRGSAENLHLIERFTLGGPGRLHYEITVSDPTTWTQPWTAMVPMSQSDDPLFEYACHEGNIGMAGILGGARADEAAAAREGR